MFDHRLAAAVLVISGMLSAAAVKLGYYEGGTVFWEARNPNNPREISVDFELYFDSSKDSSTHTQCTQESIDSHKKLRTGGKFRVGDTEVWADYYCTHLNRQMNVATGVYNLTYILPPYEDTAVISYNECCWIPGIVNNGRDIGNGKGWNLTSTININHGGDNAINSPPQSRTFPKYPIMSGCDYTIKIETDDANNDKVKCRWTKVLKDECNINGLDICGKPYFDEDKQKKLAALDPKNCTLRFGESEAIPPGTYALMVMLEDYAPSRRIPMSKTPVHFLMDVFYYDGDCRKPDLKVPDDMCFAHIRGQEFTMSMVATTTASYYSITSIIVQGYPTDAPRRVPGTESDYEVIFRFTPREVKTYFICAMAYEDEKFVSSHACFKVKSVQEENMPGAPRVDRANSIPARGEEEAEAVIPNWAIKFTENIQKGVFSPAYVTLRNSLDAVVWKVDATGPDVVVVGSDTLTFPNSHKVYLENEESYTISLDEGVVQSGNGCSVKSRPSQWSFITKPAAPAYREDVECSVSSMAMYLLKTKHDLGGYGPEIMHLRDPGCTGLNYNDSHYAIFTSYSQCGTVFAHYGTDFTYSNTIYIPEQPYTPPGTEVTRVRHEEVRITCSIPAKTIKTIKFNPDPDIIGYTEYNGRADFLDALSATSLQLFESGDYQRAIKGSFHPLDVSFDTRLYFQGKAVCPGSQPCDTFFQSCWATTSENPYNWPRHELIKDGCIEDNTLRLHEAGDSHKTRFSVDAFAFLGWRIQDTVYVHCNVFVCDSDDYASLCKVGCFRSSFERASRRDIMTVVSSPGLVRHK